MWSRSDKTALPDPLSLGNERWERGNLEIIGRIWRTTMNRNPDSTHPERTEVDSTLPARQVLVLSHRSLYAEGIAELLRRQCCLKVTQMIASHRTARRRVQQENPDIVLVDSQDTGLNPDALVPALSRARPNLQIICLSLGDECPRTCPVRVERVNTKDELLKALGECVGSGAYLTKPCTCAGLHETLDDTPVHRES